MKEKVHVQGSYMYELTFLSWALSYILFLTSVMLYIINQFNNCSLDFEMVKTLLVNNEKKVQDPNVISASKIDNSR